MSMHSCRVAKQGFLSQVRTCARTRNYSYRSILNEINVQVKGNRLASWRNLQCDSQRTWLRFHLNSYSTVSSPLPTCMAKLRNAAELGHGEEAEQTLNEMIDYIRNIQVAEHQLEGRNLEPSAVSLALIAWANSRQIDAAERAYNLLERINDLSKSTDGSNKSPIVPPPSRDDYHTVMKSWSRRLSSTIASQAGERADQLLQAMEGAAGGHQKPTSATLEHYTKILVNVGQVAKAQQFLVDRFGKFMAASDNQGTLSEAATVAQPNLTACNIVLCGWSRLSHETSARQAEDFLRQMHKYFEDGILADKPNLQSFNAVIDSWSALSSSSNSSFKQVCFAAERAHHLFDAMKKAGIHPTAATYDSVISILSRAGFAERAERLLSRQVLDYSAQFDADLKPRTMPFQNVLMAWSKSRHPQAAHRAESFLKNMIELYDAELFDTKPGLYCYNYVLHCWAQSENAVDAGQRSFDLLEQMQDRDIAPDTSSINCCLEAFARSKTVEETEALLLQFCRKHVEDSRLNPQPDVISFTTVLKSWAKANLPESPDKIMSLLIKLNQYGWDSCKPDVVCYSIAINCWSKSNREDAAEQAEAVLRLMLEAERTGERRLQPDSFCWNGVINAWSLNGNGERAEAIFEEMLNSYLKGHHSAKPCKMTFTALISAWTKTRSNPDAPARANQVLRRMQELHSSGVIDDKPNVYHYTAVLDCLAYTKTKWAAEKAEAILREMAASEDLDVRPNLVSYNSVLRAWSYTRSPQAVDRVTRLLNEIVDLVQGNSKMQLRMHKSFGSVLKTIADSKLPNAEKRKRAEAIVATMQKFRVDPDDWIEFQLEKCRLGRMSRRQQLPRRNG